MAGFPAWLFASAAVLGWAHLKIWPLPGVGPVEEPPGSATTGALFWAAFIGYLIAYPATLLLAHHAWRRPWIVFVCTLLPVLAFCWAFVLSSIAESRLEAAAILAYPALLALVYAAGAVTAVAAALQTER